MGHIKTNKTLHLTEILTFLKSFNNYLQSTEDEPSQTSFSFFKNNWFSGLNSATPSENHMIWAYLSCLYAVNIFSKHRRGTTRTCMEFPGLYGDLLDDQLVQTVSQGIWLAKSQSVNSIQPGKFHTSTGCPSPMFAESVYRVNTTNKLKQCGSRKVLQRYYWVLA